MSGRLVRRERTRFAQMASSGLVSLMHSGGGRGSGKLHRVPRPRILAGAAPSGAPITSAIDLTEPLLFEDSPKASWVHELDKYDDWILRQVNLYQSSVCNRNELDRNEDGSIRSNYSVG